LKAALFCKNEPCANPVSVFSCINSHRIVLAEWLESGKHK
jgi:hypothetical protein